MTVKKSSRGILPYETLNRRGCRSFRSVNVVDDFLDFAVAIASLGGCSTKSFLNIVKSSFAKPSKDNSEITNDNDGR